jgi:hypothetical protein
MAGLVGAATISADESAATANAPTQGDAARRSYSPAPAAEPTRDPLDPWPHAEEGGGAVGDATGLLPLTPGPWWRPEQPAAQDGLPSRPASPWWRPGLTGGITQGTTADAPTGIGPLPGARMMAGGRGQGWTPVEQAVGDLDPLSRSLRQVETGIGQFGQGTSLYQVDGRALNPVSLHQEPMYYRMSPGVRARVGRMDYLVPTEEGDVALNMPPGPDGRLLELIPPNTVFDLALPGQGSLLDAVLAPPMLGPDQRLSSPPGDARLNGRIDGRLDQRVNGRVESRPSSQE